MAPHQVTLGAAAWARLRTSLNERPNLGLLFLQRSLEALSHERRDLNLALHLAKTTRELLGPLRCVLHVEVRDHWEDLRKDRPWAVLRLVLRPAPCRGSKLL